MIGVAVGLKPSWKALELLMAEGESATYADIIEEFSKSAIFTTKN